MKLWGLMIAGAILAAPGLACAQEEMLTTEAPRAQGAEDWRAFARTDTLVYLVDVGGIAGAPELRTATLARVRRAHGERGPELEMYEFSCPDKRMRMTRSVELDDAGAEVGAYDETGDFESVPDGSVIDFLRQIACDGLRPEARGWPNLRAFLASPRA